MGLEEDIRRVKELAGRTSYTRRLRPLPAKWKERIIARIDALMEDISSVSRQISDATADYAIHEYYKPVMMDAYNYLTRAYFDLNEAKKNLKLIR